MIDDTTTDYNIQRTTLLQPTYYNIQNLRGKNIEKWLDVVHFWITGGLNAILMVNNMLFKNKKYVQISIFKDESNREQGDQA